MKKRKTVINENDRVRETARQDILKELRAGTGHGPATIRGSNNVYIVPPAKLPRILDLTSEKMW